MLQKFLWEQEDIRQQEIRRGNTFCSPEGRAAFNLIHFLPSAKIKNFHGNNLKNTKHKPKQHCLHETAERMK